jgi:hypothetical protein
MKELIDWRLRYDIKIAEQHLSQSTPQKFPFSNETSCEINGKTKSRTTERDREINHAA